MTMGRRNKGRKKVCVLPYLLPMLIYLTLPRWRKETRRGEEGEREQETEC